MCRKIGKMGRAALLLLVPLAGCADPPDRHCFDDVECDGGFCSYGTCEAWRGRGERCEAWHYVDGAGFVETSSDCAPGFVCSAVSGKCGPPAPIGARCGLDGDCGAHPSFRRLDDPVCVPEGDEGRCAPPRTVEAGGECLGDRACAGGLLCRKNPGGRSTCRGPGGEGEGCERDAVRGAGAVVLCLPGLHCAAGESPICVPRIRSGEACPSSDSCMEGLICRSGACGYPSARAEACAADTECAAAFVCIAGSCAPPSTLGGPCDGRDHCEEGGQCILGICAPPSGDGGRCVQNDDCIEGLRCEMGTCRSSLTIGDACEGSYSCGPSHPCVNNVCSRTSGPGGVCGANVHCGDGLFCQAGVCVFARVDGAPCSYQSVCESGWCDYRVGACAPAPQR